MTPKVSKKPAARRKRMKAYDSPFSVVAGVKLTH
jgi:hypothetical protein